MDVLFLLQSIGYVYTDLMRAIGAAEKIFQFIDRKPEIENTGTLAPSTMAGHVEFKNVTFAYPTRPDTDILKVSERESIWRKLSCMA